MEKSKIFIVSSGRTLVLAEKLRDELQTDYCDGILWSEEGRRQLGDTIIGMLETSAENYDFVVIILSKDDTIIGGADAARKAYDNCVFEAGFFMASLGRERCFLVSSVMQKDLPSNLGGIVFLPFEESEKLTDRDACAQAICNVSKALKEAVKRIGPIRYQRVPLLSVEEVFNRERPDSVGGDLHEGLVVVCDVQPIARLDLALQVWDNLRHGISYLYFLQGTGDTVAKVIQLLQVLLVKTVDGTESASNSVSRKETVLMKPKFILAALSELCETQRFLVSFLPYEPPFQFRLHNARDPNSARLYMKFRERGFMPWAEGKDANKISSETLPRHLTPSTKKCIIVSLNTIRLKNTEKQQLDASIDSALSQYFPAIEGKVKKLFCTSSNEACSWRLWLAKG